MKLAIGLAAAIGIVAPAIANAEISFSLRARVAPQCQVIAVDAAEGSNLISVSTACNMEQFALVVAELGDPSIQGVTSQNAVVDAAPDGLMTVAVENPGVQTFGIVLDAPLGAELPEIFLKPA